MTAKCNSKRVCLDDNNLNKILAGTCVMLRYAQNPGNITYWSLIFLKKGICWLCTGCSGVGSTHSVGPSRPLAWCGLLVQHTVWLGVTKQLKVGFVQLVQLSPHFHGDLGKPGPLPAGCSAVAGPRGEVHQVIHFQQLEQVLRVRFKGFQSADEVVLHLAGVAQAVHLKQDGRQVGDSVTFYAVNESNVCFACW